ncbi:winged helix-turn-helix transcriptional regulator [Actinopolymorpha pittospori]|uniref:DNA-binding HxlR family transcriptional regulator n=1 Tax=Actinopolymorpha pittospori TaxID=648752 RepID=A0A927N3A6_9ACTN|nr:helix-turn-helix domain-containing protein [Actinopolymorpha pittospori]MBE1611870.1 DNA-binding HxlR family transcriptional regulator [Actinopolymorpha pittospori]
MSPQKVTRSVTRQATAPQPVPRDCPIADALQIIGERWTLLAVREINYGVHRFEQIVANTGASRDILAARLRGLESAGVISRRQYSEHPPRYEYHLTAAGDELRPVLLTLAQWGLRWARTQNAPEAVLRHACRHELEVDLRCRHCDESIVAGSYAIDNA